jgi:hypothetical protein
MIPLLPTFSIFDIYIYILITNYQIIFKLIFTNNFIYIYIYKMTDIASDNLPDEEVVPDVAPDEPEVAPDEPDDEPDDDPEVVPDEPDDEPDDEPEVVPDEPDDEPEPEPEPEVVMDEPEPEPEPEPEVVPDEPEPEPEPEVVPDEPEPEVAPDEPEPEPEPEPEVESHAELLANYLLKYNEYREAQRRYPGCKFRGPPSRPKNLF